MAYRQLYLFVEGTDDERWVDKCLRPLLRDTYQHVKFITYAQTSLAGIKALIKTYQSQPSSEYWFLADFDQAKSPQLCVTKRKAQLRNKYGAMLEEDRILIVKEEIESWYLAGMNEAFRMRHRMGTMSDTTTLTKEAFEKLKPKAIQNIELFKIELLDHFDLDAARRHNASLDYVMRKMLS